MLTCHKIQPTQLSFENKMTSKLFIYKSLYIYIYIYIEREREREREREMVDFVKSDKMIKITGKVDKSTQTMDSAI